MLTTAVSSQEENSDWQAGMDHLLDLFLQCNASRVGEKPCGHFLAMALKRVYSIDDFLPDLLPKEIAGYVDTSSHWNFLGWAWDQKVLNEAQDYANHNRGVIAVLPYTPHGHVALILPGEVEPSGTWRLKVPHSAGFFHKPKASYVGKKLSYSFSSPDRVRIYGRIRGTP